MEHRKYSKVSPKKVKAWSQNNRKSMSGPPFWRGFGPGSLPRDALATMLGWNPEKSQKDHFLGTLFVDHFWRNPNVFLWRFFVMFFNLMLTSFLVSEHPRAPIWSPFGYQVHDISNKCGKVATAFSLERGHRNQVFQGLCFTTIHHFLIRVVETCDCHPSSKALFTLSSIYGTIWHPIWDPNLQYFALHFSNDFFTK